MDMTTGVGAAMAVSAREDLRSTYGASASAARRSRGDDYVGMTLTEAAAVMDTTTVKAASRLSSFGLRRGDGGRYERMPSLAEIEDEISARAAAAPPAAPCFRCGCKICACADRRAA